MSAHITSPMNSSISYVQLTIRSSSSISSVRRYVTSVGGRSGSGGASFSRNKRHGRPSLVAASIASHHFDRVKRPVCVCV